MKTVILAGGRGTRLGSESQIRPKPMIDIGGKPLLWHIMGHYATAGHEEFLVALGYKAEAIKSYFLNLREMNANLTLDLGSGGLEHHGPHLPPWKIHLLDTGLDSQTGARLRRLAPWLKDETFMLTYGDGLSDVDIAALVAFHRSQGKLATVTAVRPPARFGALNLPDGEALVQRFDEKPQVTSGWINGGYFVLEPGVFDYLDGGDEVIWERGPLERLAADGQLAAWRHEGFWHPIDTPREWQIAQDLWRRGEAPWAG